LARRRREGEEGKAVESRQGVDERSFLIDVMREACRRKEA